MNQPQSSNIKPHTINWGIIGCGNVTEVKSGPALYKVQHSQLVAVMRRDEEKAKDYAARHGVPSWYSNAQQLIDDPHVNAIYVATPPQSHEEYAIKALQAGKPVYLEKPMAMDTASAERIAAVAKRTGVKLSIAHYRRQQPLFLKIRSLLQEGAIGHVRLVHLELLQSFKSPLIMPSEEPWRFNPAISGGGLFHDLAPHQLDLMINFFGKVKQAGGISLNTAGQYVPDDTVSGQVLFENEILFNGIWSFVVPEVEAKDKCMIIGSEGTISFSVFGSTELKLTKNGTDEVMQFDRLEHVQQPMIGKVVQYFLGEAPNPSPAEDGVEVMRIIDAFTKK